MIRLFPKPATLPLLLTMLALIAATGRAQPPKVDLPETTQQHLDVVYATHGDRDMHVDLFVPKADKPRPCVVVVHGGGWHKGDKEKFRPLAKQLASHGFVTAAIEYRLAGEAKFPAAVDDCTAAVKWLRTNAAKYNIDAKRIAAVGGSAGGHLVGMMATTPEVNLQAAVVLAGPWELATGIVAEKSRHDGENSNANRWLGKTIDEDEALYKQASPLRHITKATPPTLFMVGESDNPQRNAAARAKLRAVGVESRLRVYPGGSHGCWNRDPWFTVMARDMALFFKAMLDCQVESPPQTLAEGKGLKLAIVPGGVLLTCLTPQAAGPIVIPSLGVPIGEVYLQNDEAKKLVTVKPNVGSSWTISLPKAIAAGEAVMIHTEATVDFLHVPSYLSASPEGETILPAHRADVKGTKLRYEPQPHKNTIGYWTNPNDLCDWEIFFDQPGTFDVLILQGCGKGHGGSTANVSLLGSRGASSLEFTVEDTGHFQNFEERHLGQLTVNEPGLHILRIKPIKKASVAVMDVRQLRLVPKGQ